MNTPERTIFHHSGSGLEWHPRTHDLRVIAQCHVLLIDDYFPELAKAAAKATQEHGVRRRGLLS